jgi:exodeoxyribonuclease VII large subunit
LLEQILSGRLQKMEQALQRQKSMLRALGPESAFDRGFSITMTKDGKLVRSVDAVEPGEALVTKLKDGELQSEVK